MTVRRDTSSSTFSSSDLHLSPRLLFLFFAFLSRHPAFLGPPSRWFRFAFPRSSIRRSGLDEESAVTPRSSGRPINIPTRSREFAAVLLPLPLLLASSRFLPRGTLVRPLSLSFAFHASPARSRSGRRARHAASRPSSASIETILRRSPIGVHVSTHTHCSPHYPLCIFFLSPRRGRWRARVRRRASRPLFRRSVCQRRAIFEFLTSWHLPD